MSSFLEALSDVRALSDIKPWMTDWYQTRSDITETLKLAFNQLNNNDCSNNKNRNQDNDKNYNNNNLG